MKDVVLIRPLCRMGEKEFQEPLGIERLAGYLLDHGICKQDILLLDRRLYQEERAHSIVQDNAPTFWEDFEAVYPRSGKGPSFVGLSLMTADDVSDALRIISRVHAWYPAACIFAGGMYVTTAIDMAKRAFPRYVKMLIGEGERELLKLVSDKDGEFEGYASPNEWAFAYRPNLERYVRLGCAVSLQTSRGCTGRCAFCATPQMPQPLCLWQARSVDLVADEMAQLVSRLENTGQMASFNIVDDNFGSLQRLEELAQALRQRNVRTAFSCEMRMVSFADQKDLKERLSRLKEDGLIRLFIGLESLDKDTLRRWDKPVPLDHLEPVTSAIKEAGIQLQLGYIMWHEATTVESAREEAVALHELGLYTHRATLGSMIVYPGSALALELDSEEALGRVQEPRSLEASEFRKKFMERTEVLTQVWLEAAIELPMAASCAHLLGKKDRLAQLEGILEQVNDISYRLFMGFDESIDIEREAARLSKEFGDNGVLS